MLRDTGPENINEISVIDTGHIFSLHIAKRIELGYCKKITLPTIQGSGEL